MILCKKPVKLMVVLQRQQGILKEALVRHSPR